MAADELVAALARKGFVELERRSGRRRLVRRGDDRHDHVRLALVPTALLARVLRRPRTVEHVVVAVLWPVGERAFSRPVPTRPVLPQQAHAATSFDGLLARRRADAATLAAAVDDWSRRLEDPARALELGAITEAVRRLEFAAITGRVELAGSAAAEARSEAEQLRPAPRREALRRIEVAEQRLGP